MKRNIRLAAPSDAGAILAIYAPYITDTAITFETEIPDTLAFSGRIEQISSVYPFLVCEIDDVIIGYAYASRHRERAAYMYDVDVSIYISPEYHGSGMSHILYDCLFILLRELGVVNAYVAYTEPNVKSRRFHEKYGFTVIGTHHKTGYKLGEWHDVTWLEKAIDTHHDRPKEPRSITDLTRDYLERLFHSYEVV